MCEWNGNAIRCEIWSPVNGICGKTWLCLLSIRDDGRTGSFEALDGIGNCLLRYRIKLILRKVALLPFAHRINKVQRPRYASNRFCRNGHWVCSLFTAFATEAVCFSLVDRVAIMGPL